MKGVSRKFQQKYIGPYLCTKLAGPTAQLALPPELGGVHPWFHSSLLKPYHGPPIQEDTPEVDQAAGGEEYEVERILDRRISRGKVEYLVKWRNYDNASNSWEPRSNLTNCQELLREFEDSRRPSREGKRPLKLTEKMVRFKEDQEDFT